MDGSRNDRALGVCEPGPIRRRVAHPRTPDVFPPDLVLTLVSRRPSRLPEATVAHVLAAPVPVARRPAYGGKDRRRRGTVSIIVACFNQLAFTKLCLASLLANTEASDCEVIVVDNGSSDGTPAYLAELAAANPSVRVVSNRENLGFARANNQGLALARGEVLVLLNNDTIVPPGALARLVRHLDDPSVGSAGPVTNRIGNAAEIEADYDTYGELLAFAERRARRHDGVSSAIEMSAMFCMAMRRDVFERIGPIDERYGIGMLEDDDYALRLLEKGYRAACAEDVFVHHFDKASFGDMFADGAYSSLLRTNQARFAEKWGRAWQPYRRRPRPGYRDLVRQVRDRVEETLPPGSVVLVISKGDGELTRFAGRQGWHFPRMEDGAYAGHYPPDSVAAIEALETWRARGGDYLLLPWPSAWWLEHYAGFRQHLEHRYDLTAREEGVCLIFDLRGER